ncbi:unnamed protein product [Meloidogyne enterolobii]|uniref:Uncharacterized protein n=1 Tax=Meloidogyne enterolobii TaxID=390850 RepID=A0ACB0YTB3_MELEN
MYIIKSIRAKTQKKAKKIFSYKNEGDCHQLKNKNSFFLPWILQPKTARGHNGV